jgi:nucleoside-diphosphate-sugar epimerase
MSFPRLRTILLVPLILFALVYVAGAITLAMDDRVVAVLEASPENNATVVIFGASGTAGDGILEVALADPDIRTIHVITRRSTPRIEEGVASGKVCMTQHMDYLDYSAIREQISEADAVYWAIGTSSVGLDEETYAMIHVDFPLRFVEEWVAVSEKTDISFHYISSSDISEDSRMMWAREKVRAEKSLFAFAAGTKLRVVAYRPDYIGPTEQEAHLGHRLVYWFFRPVGAAVKATEIGQAMLEVSARGTDFENGDKLGTGSIVRYSDAYERRRASTFRQSSL